jgi:nitrate/TMAO reductase-like tetraheme cytochrome c subunit
MKLFAERQYEQFLFNLRSDHERIAVQSYCEKCKSKQNLALHYLDLISPTGNDGIRAKCPSCISSSCISSSLIYGQD